MCRWDKEPSPAGSCKALNSRRLCLGESEVRLVTYRYANVTCTIHSADEKPLEKWRCPGTSVLSSVESSVTSACLFFSWSSICHRLGSTSDRGFSKLLQHANFNLLSVISIPASQHFFFFLDEVCLFSVGDWTFTAIEKFCESYCFHTYFYQRRHSEQTSWIYCFVLTVFNTFEILSFDKKNMGYYYSI